MRRPTDCKTFGMLSLPLLVLGVANAAAQDSLLDQEGVGDFHYPSTRIDATSDDYHGHPIEDPFRWLENTDSEETQAWVIAQNEITFDYLRKIPERDSIAKRLSELWNYERFGFPLLSGASWVYSHNDGLQNQNVLYRSDSLDGERVVLLDPNKLSDDGTVALTGYKGSPDGKRLAYGIAKSGSDWNVWRIRDVESGQDLPDTLEWVKFSSVEWTKDNEGFFYCRYDAPESDSEFTGVNYYQKLYYHRVGTSQDQDVLVYDRDDEKEWGFTPTVSDDGAYLVISVWRGTERKNQLFYAELESGHVPQKSDVKELLIGFDADYAFLGNDGGRWYLETDHDAPMRRIVEIDLDKPQADAWREVVPERDESIVSSHLFGDTFFVTYLHHATSLVRRIQTDGTSMPDLSVPELGTVSGFEGKRDSGETFYSFTNYITPPTTYRLDLKSGESSVWKRPQVAFDPEDYQTDRIFYSSKDGTKIPLIVSYKKGLIRDGNARAFLYAYGGFNISITPGFSPANLAWMEQGGIYAVANLRGGGEYGREWHEAGMLENKQNCFDDFIAAAEYLIDEKYTNSHKLAVHGRSNGGLLIGAVMTQRPELFAVALPAVGVMDMLRFQKFTIGWAWVSEFGSSDDASQFENLLSYSPLHNLKPGTHYPATMVTTADRDDRVVPGHSFKFAARLQACQIGRSPALIRIETSAGHGAGTPVSKLIDAAADMWAFVIDNTRDSIDE